MPKKNPMLERIRRYYAEAYDLKFHHKVDMLLQMAADCAFVAAAEVLDMPPEKAEEFGAAMTANVNELAHIMVEDQKDDEQYVYAREKLDQRLREIIPEDKFMPFEQRYNFLGLEHIKEPK